MFDNKDYVTSSQRKFQSENIPRIEISLFNEKSKLEINRIFMPIESTLVPKKNVNNNKIQSFHPVIDATVTSRENLFSRKLIQQQKSNKKLLSKTPQIMNTIDHAQPAIAAYKHERRHSPSSVIVHKQQVSLVPINVINEHQPSSSSEVPINHLIIRTMSPVQQPLSPPFSQLIPDSIINDKQTRNRIYNEQNLTHFTRLSKLVPLTPINSVSENFLKSIDQDTNHVRYYQIGSIFTTTSTLIMHQNEINAHAANSDPFLSDTIFIILIATLTIIILLFCFGLFCLCRRTTKRNISPSFDGGSYAGLHGHSFEIPMDDYQQRISKYGNDLSSSSVQPNSVINHSPLTNDGRLLPQTIALHHTAKQKAKQSKQKLKKKRVGFCCCNSKSTSTSSPTLINARTRIKRNDM